MNNRVVLADGCFDPLHYGHIRYLRSAYLRGNRLLVNIAPDAAIRAKGREPFQTRAERAKTVAALRIVTHAVQYESLEIAILMLRPSVLVKGEDWRYHLPAEVLEACEDVGTELVYTDTKDRTSTDRLLGLLGESR